MSSEEAAERLREDGVVLLRGVLPSSLVERFWHAAVSCFTAVEDRPTVAKHHRLNRFSNSLLIEALADASLVDSPLPKEELIAPVTSPEPAALFSKALGGDWDCRLEHSWLRKKFAPGDSPDGRNVSQGWHQDGGLGVHFPEPAGSYDERGYWISTAPMTELVTCWIPLDACGVDAPGLEFVRGPQPGLLHFTELADGDLRQRFDMARFWAPEMEPGDAVVFQNSVLHRTQMAVGMTQDRVSVEYRVFPMAR
ncbi:phytanoyl-CoA dioxygenase family protein [Acidicapsa dinghuensis]|uniref:Phytanoyl-CoA dioxygenase family protein n=1 Tax=Acidicapsa dinghuensis TaxID=2218256 RepID=A0ABW1EAB4_9BACT|nr:phytanoyl-CoA dioxygenase family protein [Acidicapsa dinghuensis]